MELTGPNALDSLTVDDLCEIARDSTRAQELSDYLGVDSYQGLMEALKDPLRKASRGPQGTVVLMHGIMGSQIGKELRKEWDIVWLNPFAMSDGNFSFLKLGTGRSKYGPRGLLPIFYALLWARLKYWYGYNVVEFAYDWRVGVQESGDELVEFIDKKTSGPVFLVAHSMGGLVARAALPNLDDRVQRIVQLAAPNYGSFSPVVTFRGQNAFVNNLMKLDLSTTVTNLLSSTVSTFQGLYELMPAPSRFSSVNLFDSSIWPASPSVNASALAKAKVNIGKLPDPDRRFVLIAGTGQQTVTDMSIDQSSGEFRFTTTTEGDGTVPLRFARFDTAAQVPTYLANVTHYGIIVDGTVCNAVDDLLRTGQTTRLQQDTGVSRRNEIRRPLDVSQALDPLQGGDGGKLSVADIRAIQRSVLGSMSPESASAGNKGGRSSADNLGQQELLDSGFKNVTVGRRRRRLRLIIAQGDITKMPAHAHVLGVFAGVTPSGPARAFDELLGGAISDLVERQLFSGTRGKIFFLPTYKTAVPGDLLTFAGLGSFNDFQLSVVEDVAQQIVQSLLPLHVTELATVILGGTIQDVKKSLQAMLKGFIKGLIEADDNFEFQRIIICESDTTKFEDLKSELYRLASSTLFDDVEVDFDVIQIPGPSLTRVSTKLPTASESALFLFSHLSIDPKGQGPDAVYKHEVSVLPPDSGTSFERYIVRFSKADFDNYLKQVQMGAPRNLDDFGTGLAKLVLPKDLLMSYKDVLSRHRLQVLHNALSSRIPWESLKFDDIWPAISHGLSRTYERDQTPVMLSRSQQQNQVLRILLVYNPTGDLDGAEQEGQRILKVTAKWSGKMQVTTLHGSEATRAAIVNCLKTQSIDILHYAGHAGFNADNRDQSGLVCAGADILSGRDLKQLGSQLPPVIILNACESGRVRKAVPVEVENGPASVAEAILNAGIVCFIATYWPVSDSGADIFADTFYDKILSSAKPYENGNSVGDAVLAARQALKSKNESDWANYMLYGNREFVLKTSFKED